MELLGPFLTPPICNSGPLFEKGYVATITVFFTYGSFLSLLNQKYDVLQVHKFIAKIMITQKKFLAKCCLFNKRLCFILVTCLCTLLIIDAVFKKSIIKSKKVFALDLTIPLADLAKRDEMKKNSPTKRSPEIIETIVQNTYREKQSNEKEELEEKANIKQENIGKKVIAFLFVLFVCLLEIC